MGPLFSFFKSLKTVSQSGLPYLARFFNPVIRSRFSCNCNNSTLSLSLGLGATQNPSFAQEEIFRDILKNLFEKRILYCSFIFEDFRGLNKSNSMNKD